MAVDDETLSKLLKLKRYEQPPPEYFDNFLREFQERQRAEMLRRPAWRLVWERFTTRWAGFCESLSLPQLSYAGASVAVVAVATVFTVQMLQHPGGGRMEMADASGNGVGSPEGAAFVDQGMQVASASVTPAQAARGASASSGVVPNLDRFTLNAEFRMPEVRFQQRDAAGPSQPRYILDTRPASYEASYSF